MDVLSDDEGNLVFLYQLVDGSTNTSFACHVASVAGIPRAVVARGKAVRAGGGGGVLFANGQIRNQETRVFGHCIQTLVSVDTDTRRLDVCGYAISGEN